MELPNGLVGGVGGFVSMGVDEMRVIGLNVAFVAKGAWSRGWLGAWGGFFVIGLCVWG